MIMLSKPADLSQGLPISVDRSSSARGLLNAPRRRSRALEELTKPFPRERSTCALE